MFVVGLGGIAMSATANTVIQLAVPDQLRGRVMSVYTTVFAGSTPIGGVLMGWVAAQFGVGESLVVAGIICGAIGAGAWAWLRRIDAGRVAARRVTVEQAIVDEGAGATTFGRPR
jgi:MFS family permease